MSATIPYPRAHEPFDDRPDFHVVCDRHEGAGARRQNPSVFSAGESGEDHLATDHRHADLAGLGFSRRISDEDIAVLDAAGGEGMAFDARRITARAAQIENGGQIQHALNVVLSRRLKAGCLMALIRALALALG